MVFVLNNILTLGILRSSISTSQDVFAAGPIFKISDSTWYHQTTLSHLATELGHSIGVFQALSDCHCGVWCRGLNTYLYACLFLEIDF